MLTKTFEINKEINEKFEKSEQLNDYIYEYMRIGRESQQCEGFGRTTCHMYRI